MNGHFISSSVKQVFLKKFTNHKLYVNHVSELKKIKEIDIYHKLINDNYKLIKNTFYEAEQELMNNAKYDVNFSGTTANVLFLIQNKVICANCGDSRAFLAKDKRTTPSFTV